MSGGSYMGGISHADKFKSGRFFCLSWKTHQAIYSGDMGTGSSETTARFQTEEGRTYFIQAEQLREQFAQLVDQLSCVQEKLRKIEEKREQRRRKRLDRLGKLVCRT